MVYGDIRWGDYRSNRLELPTWLTYAGTRLQRLPNDAAAQLTRGVGILLQKSEMITEMMVLIQQYSGFDGHSSVSSPCGAVEVTIWPWVACVSKYYTTRWRRGRHYTLKGRGMLIQRLLHATIWFWGGYTQQYDFEVDTLPMDCHCCFLLLAPFYHHSQYVLRLQWTQKLTINLRYLSGEVSVNNYAISSEGFGNFHCYHRVK